MSIRAHIKRKIRKIRERHKLVSYANEDKFDVSFEVELKNESSHSYSGFLVIPVPSDGLSQTLLAETTFIPKIDGVSKDEVYSNRFAFWRINLGAGKSERFIEKFSIKTIPFRESATKQVGNEFLSQNKCLTIDNETIKDVIHSLKKRSISNMAFIRGVNRYVINHLVYGNPIEGLYSSEEALKYRNVDCGGFSSLFVSMCVASGIPARIVSGFFAGYSENSMHAWVEVMVNNKWIPADPATEHLAYLNRTNISGYLGFVGSDRIVLSRGCDITIKVDNNSISIPILQNPFIFPKQSELIVKNSFITKKL